MTDIDLHLVREFFEMQRFRIMTHWQQHSPGPQRTDAGLQLFAENTNPAPARDLGVVLLQDDLKHVERAVIEIRPWHSERFYSSVIESNPVVTLFAEPEALAPAREFFGGHPFKTILVVSEMPLSPEQRGRTVECIRESKVDHLLEFPTVLRTLVDTVSLNGSYAASHSLQTIQLLRRYRLVDHQQMEFDFPVRRARKDLPKVETAELLEGRE